MYLREVSTHEETISNLMKMAEIYPDEEKNCMGKGEIARNEQFLYFPQCFIKTFTLGT